MLDFLAAVDDPAAGQVEVVVHLVDVDARLRHLVRTRVDRAAPVLDSLVPVLPGAAWHEREAHEMVGVGFAGNDDLRPLLTTGDAGHPLRRTTPLVARVGTPWPGASDPADRPAEPTAGGAGGPGAGRIAARPRSRLAPPGIPAEWTVPEEGR
jgi:NADH-quinone oxidoreductase subunit C